MAENESLDLMDRNSGRWRKLLKYIETKEPPEKLAPQVLRYLYKLWQNLVKQKGFLLEQMLSAASGESGHIQEIVRRCRSSRDYAKLFEIEARQGGSDQRIIERVNWAIIDRYFDQYEERVLGSNEWPSAFEIHGYLAHVKNLIRENVAHLSQRVASHPQSPPRTPHALAADHDREQQNRYEYSLLPNKLGTSR